MPEEPNHEFIKGLINFCLLYNVFISEGLSYDSSRVIGDITEEVREQTKQALINTISASEDWQFVKSAQAYDIIASQDAFISTNINDLSSEEEYESFELIGQNTQSEVVIIGERLYINCKNPHTFSKKMVDGKIIYAISPTIHIEKDQIIGVMHRKPKLDIHQKLSLNSGNC